MREPHPVRLPVRELPEGVPEGDLLRPGQRSPTGSHQRAAGPGEVGAH